MTKDRLAEFQKLNSSKKFQTETETNNNNNNNINNNKETENDSTVKIKFPFTVKHNKNNNNLKIQEEGKGRGGGRREAEKDYNSNDFEKKKEEKIKKFLFETEKLKEKLEELEGKIEECRKIQISMLTVAQNEEQIKLKKTLEENSKNIKLLSKHVQNKLKEISELIREEEKENEEKLKIGERKEHWAELRIKKIQHRALWQKFTDLINNYTEHQVNYRENCKKRMQKTLQIAEIVMTEEEMDDLLEKETTSLFTDQYNQNVRKAKLDLQEIEERHQELICLEKNISELKDLFFDLSHLVENQGSKIYTIETNVLKSEDYVRGGVHQTSKAIQHKKKTNKIKLCLLMVGIFFGIFLIISVLLSIFI